MKIIISGVGGMGAHLTQLLEREKHDIVVIDTNQDVLDYVSNHSDVLTVTGDSSSLRVLEEAKIKDCDLFISVTTSEKNNLISSILAKKLGAKKTIARIDNPEYLTPKQKEEFKSMGIDTLISPTQLATNEVKRLIKECHLTDLFDFEGGKMSLLGYIIDDSEVIIGIPLHRVIKIPGYQKFRPIAILRKGETIIPNGDTVIKAQDHLYFLTHEGEKDEVMCMINDKIKEIKKIMIVGSTSLAFNCASMLENKYEVKLISSNKEFCTKIAEKLPKTLILNGNPNNIDLLKEEGLEKTDAYIALTENSETNIITSFMAENIGVFKTIALVENTAFTNVSQNIGVDTIINTKIIGANNIFRFIRKGKIEAITSLHGVDAEVIEFIIQKNSKITKDIIMHLNFPKNAIIAGVIRGEETFLPRGDFKIEADDKVIIFAKYSAIKQVEDFIN